MAQPAKLATPADAVAVRPPVQLSTPPAGLLLIARVTWSLLSASTVLPSTSWIVTAIAKLPVPAAWMFDPEAGWVVKTSPAGLPAVMLKELAFVGAFSVGLLELEAVSV